MYRAAIGKMNRTFTVIVNGARLAPTALVNWNGASRLTQVISSTQVTPTQSATGVTGKLAVKIAKLLGAGRVVAAGRNQQVLTTLGKLGADATIRLDAPAEDLGEAFVREAGESGFQVVIDYMWGRPAEAFLAAITRKEFQCSASVRSPRGFRRLDFSLSIRATGGARGRFVL